MLPEDDFQSLSLLYHLNSEPWPTPAGDVTAGRPAARGDRADAAVVPLAPPVDTPFGALLARRRSVRQYADRPMESATLATLLANSTRIPSAGGLSPLALYVATRAVVDVPDGVHYYDSHTRALALLRSPFGVGLSEWVPAFLAQSFVADANVLLLLSAVFERTQRKYGPRGYRYVLFEAAHAAQNFCVTASELGLGSVCLGGFLDSRVNPLLGVDPRREAVVYAVAAGSIGREDEVP
jgi:SagB-type dehydrogenase family enzyme